MSIDRCGFSTFSVAWLRALLAIGCSICLWRGTLFAQAQYDLIHLSAAPSGYGMGVAVSGDHAFVASYTGGIRVFDISDPLIPTLVAATNSGIPYVYDRSITIAGGYAYTGAIRDTDFHVYDVSNATEPFPVTNVFSGNYVSEVLVRDAIGYVANTAEGFSVYDFSDPSAPTPVTNFAGTSASCLAMAGGYAFIGGGGMIRVYSLANPLAPVEVGVTNAPSSEAIAVKGDYAYLAHYSGVAIFDVRIPSSPQEVAPGLAIGRVADLLVSGDHLFVANSSYGVRMYDVSDPLQPIEIAHANTTGYAPVSQALCMSGNYLFVASGNTGFYICAVMPHLEISMVHSNQPCISWPEPFAQGITIEQSHMGSPGGWFSTAINPICTNGYCTIKPTGSDSSLFRLRISP